MDGRQPMSDDRTLTDSLSKAVSPPCRRSLSQFEVRLATDDDQEQIAALMTQSIRRLQEPFLDSRQIEASFDIMGLDRQLIEDGTYFVVEECSAVIGCGGWSRRATLYGGSHTPERNEALLVPARDAARIRAMYTHPAHARRGVGRLILRTCEQAARNEGFRRAELVSTLAGRPLYEACGYRVIDSLLAQTLSGVPIPTHRMAKRL